MLTRDLDDDDAKLRAYVTTDGEGASPTSATAYASRLYQFAWASHVNDVALRGQRLRHAARARDRDADAEPAQRRASADGHALRPPGAASGRAAASTSSRRAAGPRGGFRTFADGTSAATAASASPTASATRPRAGAPFQFRIKIERDSGYAYWGGYSRIAKVKVR